MRKSCGNYDADSMRELAKVLREQDITPDNCASGFRILNVLENLKIPKEDMENFLKMINGFSLANGLKGEIIKEALLQFVKISDELSLSEIPRYLQGIADELKQLENKKKIKEEVQTLEKEKVAADEKVCSSIKNASTTLANLDIFVNTKKEVDIYGIPLRGY
jgi:hypothetical protein